MTKVRIGLRIPSFPVDGSNSVEFLHQIQYFLKAFNSHYDSAWMSDHFMPWATFVSKTIPNMEGFVAISYLAGKFPRLYFGNIVLCNSYRNPALLAKMGATLQTLTGGRFILGMGAGWMEDEYRAYGYPYPPFNVRIQQLEEGIQIIKALWRNGFTTFTGKYYTVTKAYCYPKPDPIPPIMIGGGGERFTLRVVARHADWWNLPNVTPQTYEYKLQILNKHCQREHRASSEILKTLGNMIAIAKTDKQAYTIACKSPLIQKGTEDDYIIGNPDSIITKLKAYMKLGVEYFILRFLDFPHLDGAKLFITDVLPSLSYS